MPLVPGLDKLTLTDDQKAKFADLQTEYGPKRAEIFKKMQAVLTEDQVKARHDAEQAAKEAGKSPQEIRQAMDAATTLTDDQKAKMADIRKEFQPLQQEIREKVVGILTPEQKEQLQAMNPGGHKKKSDDNK